MGFKYNQKGFAYFIHSLTIAPVGISYHTGLYYNLQGLQFSKTVDDFPLSALTCIPPSGTMKANYWDVSWLVTILFLHVLWPSVCVYSAIGSYHKNLMGNQNPQQ